MKPDRWPDWLTEIVLALVLLTRLPLPRLSEEAFADGARAVWAYPLAGGLVGAIAACVGAVLLTLGLPTMIAAGGVLATLALLTGAMHEDGLADTADGFWGGQTTARRLEIMKDSQIGSYGVLALILVTGLRWGAYSALLTIGVLPVIVAAMLSRAGMPWLMARLPHARAEGLSRSVGTPVMMRALLAILLASGLGIVLIGAVTIAALASALVATCLVGAVAQAKIGGQTGDVLGAAQQLGELAVLVTLLILCA